MRVTINKRTSTKPERIFLEILKKNHIPFQHRAKVEGREIDFLIGKYAIEIDGHAQDPARNNWLVSKGYTPVHYSNHALRNNLKEIEGDIITKHGLHS